MVDVIAERLTTVGWGELYRSGHTKIKIDMIRLDCNYVRKVE
jgi:hypothetical protein